MQHTKKRWPRALLLWLMIAPLWAQAAPLQTIEAESLVSSNSAEITASDGPFSVQNMSAFGPGWSGNAQLLWRAPEPDDELFNRPKLRFYIEVPASGAFAVAFRYTQAPDYGDVRVYFKGMALGDWYGYSAQVRNQRVELGTVPLTAGKNRIELQVLRRPIGSKAAWVGLDAIEISPPGTASAPPPKKSPTQLKSTADIQSAPHLTLRSPKPKEVISGPAIHLEIVAPETLVHNFGVDAAQIDWEWSSEPAGAPGHNWHSKNMLKELKWTAREGHFFVAAIDLPPSRFTEAVRWRVRVHAGAPGVAPTSWVEFSVVPVP